MMRRAADPDSFVGDNIDIFIRAAHETVLRIPAQIHFVVPIGDVEGLRQLAGPGAKLPVIMHPASFSHYLHTTGRFECANQNETIRLAFHQHIQHPVRAVTEINIGRACAVSRDEAPRAWSRKCVTGFVVLRQIGLSFHDATAALPPNQLRANEFACTCDWVALEKLRANDFASHFLVRRRLNANPALGSKADQSAGTK
jgi:hypothetical protein